MYFQLNTWNARPAQGESETSSQVAGSQEGPKWLQKPPVKPKTLGLFQATGCLSQRGHWTSSYVKKKRKQKKGKKKTKEKEENMEMLRESNVAELPKVKKKI